MKYLIIPFLASLFFIANSCQNNKNMKNERTYLINLLKEKENHNKYLFSGNYHASMMKRAGVDYVDAHMTSSATDNFFLIEKEAVDYKKSWAAMESKETLFRCLYINEKGQIAEVIKRKIKVSKVDLDFLNIEQENIPQGISRLYNGELLVETNAFMSDIISTKKFNYFVIEKTKKDVAVYKLEILDNDNRDLVCSNFKQPSCEEIYFQRAILFYDDEGNFIDVEIKE